MEALSAISIPASDTSCIFGNCSSLHPKIVSNYRALYILGIPRWLGMGFLNHQHYLGGCFKYLLFSPRSLGK